MVICTVVRRLVEAHTVFCPKRFSALVSELWLGLGCLDCSSLLVRLTVPYCGCDEVAVWCFVKRRWSIISWVKNFLLCHISVTYISFHNLNDQQTLHAGCCSATFHKQLRKRSTIRLEGSGWENFCMLGNLCFACI